MSLLCIGSGLFYNQVLAKIVSPAVNGALNPAAYVDAMMGDGYAFSHGIGPQPLSLTAASVWDPIFWLLLFVIVTCAVTLVAVSGARERGPVSMPEGTDDKHATFFGGEKSLHSHVAGSDLFWGFKKDMKGYFKVMDSLHSGKTNDYALWVVLGVALITLFTFVFLS